MVLDMPLAIECQVVRGTGLMCLEGALVAASRFEPERIFREWLEAGVNHAIISCQRLSYIDSAGLSILLGTLHRLRRNGGDLILADMNPSLNAIFEVASLQRFFKIFATLAEAEAYFESLGADKRQPSQSVEGEKG